MDMEVFLKAQAQKEQLDSICKMINSLDGEKLEKAKEVYKYSEHLPIEERLELLENHLEGVEC